MTSQERPPELIFVVLNFVTVAPVAVQNRDGYVHTCTLCKISKKKKGSSDGELKRLPAARTPFMLCTA